MNKALIGRSFRSDGNSLFVTDEWNVTHPDFPSHLEVVGLRYAMPASSEIDRDLIKAAEFIRLARSEALEEAAKVVDGWGQDENFGGHGMVYAPLAAAIRQLANNQG